MSLSCSCDDWDPDSGDTYIDTVSNYKLTPLTGYRKRCKNCCTMIPKNSIAIEFERVKVPDGDIENAIYGEEGLIPRASWWLCERCADIYFSLDALGFCFPIDEVDQALQEYQCEYGKKPERSAD